MKAQKLPPSGDNVMKCKHLAAELDELHKKHETYWYIRARINELRDGDENTAYFHYKANSRRRRNTIKGLEGENGKWVDSEEELEQVVVR